jgi:hypothetical protein
MLMEDDSQDAVLSGQKLGDAQSLSFNCRVMFQEMDLSDGKKPEDLTYPIHQEKFHADKSFRIISGCYLYLAASYCTVCVPYTERLVVVDMKAHVCPGRLGLQIRCSCRWFFYHERRSVMFSMMRYPTTLDTECRRFRR